MTTTRTRTVRRLTSAALAATGVTAVMACAAGVPVAAAAPCPDVEVLFARGTDEPPGLGQVGDAFVSGLRERTGRDIAASAVNYPAHQDIGPGVDDLTSQLDSLSDRCPNTKIIVGGYSLGAGVTNRVLNDPLPPGVADHVAAVVLFGNASRLLDVPVAPGPAFAGKTIDMCNPGDPICSGGPLALSHLQLAYIAGGGVNAAIEFAMTKI